MHANDGSFSWSAWNPNRWDHYHHAGVQVRAYREAPFYFERPARWSFRGFLLRLIGVANA